MFELPDYSITETLYESDVTMVYRAEGPSGPVVLKTSSGEFPRPSTVARLRNEFALGSKLKLEGTVRYLDLLSHGNSCVLLIEEFNARPLRWLLRPGADPVAIDTFLGISIALAEAIEELHRHDVVHRDISPNNVFYDSDSGELKLGDLGLASNIPRTRQVAVPPGQLEGTIAYISPEQTGRMNRDVDYRTDLYSFGATLYHLITGRVPFEGEDVMSVVHGHIARDPEPPSQVRPDIPAEISSIILRLLSKAAEDRYQSAAGVTADLQRCRYALKEKGEIPHFTLAESDRSPVFTVSGRLVGRDAQLVSLLSAFDRTAEGGSELLLVRGHSGIGKSVLVHEVLRSLVTRQGLFFGGKYDQLTMAPFSGLAGALRGLLKQILTGSEDHLVSWKQRIEAALEDEAWLLVDLLPELEPLLGEQPDKADLDAVQQRIRFDERLVALIRSVADADHPLVLFLDDLQWVDPASLRVLGQIVNDPEMHHLLLIGAYRANEVDDAHPLTVALAEWQKEGRTAINLDVLGVRDLAELVADSTEVDQEEAMPLAELLRQKTGGNPFFVVRFLYRLSEEGLLFPSSEGRGWDWDLDAIRQLEVAESVLSLMLGQVGRYPDNTQSLLSRASSLGGTFDLHTLAITASVTPREAANALWGPVRDGLVLPLGKSQDLYRGAEPAADMVSLFKFAHDKIHEAVSSSISSEELAQMNAEIGRLLRDRIPKPERKARVLEFVDHLSLGAELMDPAELDELTELLLEAGLRTKAATAYDTAIRHLKKGIALLGPEGWADQYNRMTALHRECIDCIYLGGDTAGAFALFDEIKEKVTTLTERAELYTLVIRIYITEDRMAEGVQVGMHCLSLFDAAPPADPDAVQALMGEMGQDIGAMLGEKGPQVMVDGPLVQDREVAAVMVVLLETWLCGLMIGDLATVAFTTLSLVRLSLKHGNSSASPCGYVAQAALCVFQGDYEAAKMFGDAGLTLSRKMDDVSLIPKALNTYCNFKGHMVAHQRDNIAIYEESYRTCLKTGDRWWGSWAVHWARVHRFITGEVLDEVLERANAYDAYIRECGYIPLVWMSEIDKATMLCLMERTNSSGAMDHGEFSEQGLRETMAGAEFGYGLYMLEIKRAWLSYLFEDHEAALDHLDRACEVRDVIPGGPEYSEYFIYGALILAAQPDAEKHLERLDGYIEMMGGWAENGAKENFAHCHALMMAERTRISGGDDEEVRRLYDEAIAKAQENDWTHHAAMACELAGRYYISRGWARASRGYLEDALGLYRMWGATAKVEQLKKQYADLRHRPHASGSTSSDSTRTSVAGSLDMDSVLKASNALAGEIVLERLLGAVISIILENAGADRGALFLNTDENMLLQAVAEPEGTQVLQGKPLASCEKLPLSVLRYSARTREMVLEDDAANEGQFTEDLDIKARQVHSLLCLPLIHQGRLVGLLYTENSRVTAAFTDDRAEVLSLLSAQAATSLDNAQLYATLEQKVEQRTAQLQRKNEELELTLKQLGEAQSQLVESEKMAALGQLIAGVAHEINTPVGAIRASSENIQESLDQTLVQLPTLLSSLDEERIGLLVGLIRRSLEQREVFSSRELRKRRRRLEGALDDAGLEDADDIADTLVDIGIYGDIDKELPLLQGPDAKTVLQATYDLAMLQRNSQTIQDAVRQVSKVVFALKSFAHRSQEDAKVEADVVQGLENVLTIYKNYLRHDVDLVRRYGENIPQVACYPDALQQVWTNLIHNALQAMEYRGKLQVEVALEETQIIVRIIDSGPGIPADVQPHIWDAFYTTKEAGEGSGLGLHICRDIVERHSGRISFDSRPGQTVFSVSIPTS